MISSKTSLCHWLLVTAAALGCSSQTTSPKLAEEEPTANSPSSSNPVSEDNQKKLLAAKDALFIKLSGKLMETMAQNGPVAAIAVCNQEAPKIAAEVAEQQGVQIGRVGVRLRNPNNAAPDWASELIAAKTNTPTFLKLSDGKDAALLPIKLQATCLMCHGPKEQIAADVLAEIAKLYPEDQATGFQEGELRGWFWVVSGE
jgi:hypothetical protein